MKRAVDDNSRPGSFLLTGSVRADLKALTWPGTGRLVALRMFGLTERELAGSISEETFFDKLARDELDAFRLPAENTDLLGYVERALRGGYPEPALGLSAEARAAWLAGYLEQLINRGTAHAYNSLLSNLLVVDTIPAWTTNRLSRLIKAPKRYLIDSALVGPSHRAKVAP